MKCYWRKIILVFVLTFKYLLVIQRNAHDFYRMQIEVITIEEE